MTIEEGSPPRRSFWAYGYVLDPPVHRDRLGPMGALLDEGHEQARILARTWEGRFINGDDITHILVVSDQPNQDLEVNQLLEAELYRLKTSFAVTRSVPVNGDSEPGM
ncbi:MAG: hypothetical protein EA422_15000 [Gemmatimonadales bacterium]|nr:MAG: hypothetical protein EA422_15000 [Gemmatimonadales bacterium]